MVRSAATAKLNLIEIHVKLNANVQTLDTRKPQRGRILWGFFRLMSPLLILLLVSVFNQ